MLPNSHPDKVPMLSLAENSIANLGDLDANSLSEIWNVFTKCKDSLQNGRRLENLSWRLLYLSTRREQNKIADPGGGAASSSSSDYRSMAQQNGWSDPEWMSESEEDGSEMASLRSSNKSPDSSCGRSSTSPPRGRRFSSTIRGDSLQRMITDLTSAPAIGARPHGHKALSACELPQPSKIQIPPPPSRGSSAPEVPTPVMSPSNAPSSRTTVENTPRSSNKTTPRHSPRPADARTLPALASLVQDKPVVTLTPANAQASTSTAASTSALTTTTTAAAAKAQNVNPKKAPTRPRQGSGSSRRIESSTSMPKSSNSPASFEPRSYVKGFDTSAHDNRPREGAKAPPPTPAVTTNAQLAASPPKSSMKSPKASNTTHAQQTKSAKKIFFISSPNSEDEDYSDDGGRSPAMPTTKRPKPAPRASSSSSRSAADKGKMKVIDQTLATKGNNGDDDDDDEWDDEDSSSGWGSEYSTESERTSSRPSQHKQPSAFARVPSETHLKPRGPGLLSQLFHPDHIEAGKAPLSAAELARAHRSMPHMQHLHVSHSTSDALDRRHRAPSKLALRGAPEGADFESSSDEEDEQPASVTEGKNPIVIAALQKRLDETANMAPPQTPRTTRRAMLATELSESLRRNLLWERQTRNRAMGAPPTRFQSPLPPVRPPVTTSAAARSSSFVQQKGFDAPAPTRVQTTDDGFRASTPSAHQQQQQSQQHAPQEAMRRRHTTGTGLYLQAQLDKLTRSRTNSESSSASSSDSESEPTRFDAFADGLHHHGW